MFNVPKYYNSTLLILWRLSDVIESEINLLFAMDLIIRADDGVDISYTHYKLRRKYISDPFKMIAQYK